MSDWFFVMMRTSDQISTLKAALAGVATGSSAMFFAWLDPSSMELWLRLFTLFMGLITTVASGGLIALKYWDRYCGSKLDD
jgi:hypothetical protein